MMKFILIYGFVSCLLSFSWSLVFFFRKSEKSDFGMRCIRGFGLCFALLHVAVMATEVSIAQSVFIIALSLYVSSFFFVLVCYLD